MIDHEQWAKRFLLALVTHVRDFQGGDKYLTYGKIAKKVGYPEPYTGNLFGKNIGDTLGVMGHMFDDLVIDGESIPLIQSLVVSQKKKLPSDGLKEFYSTYPSLPDEKKRDFVHSEYGRIFDFGTRWEQVLAALEIQPSDELPPSGGDGRTGRHNSYGSEGSPEHVALRDFVSKNPSVIGLDFHGPGLTEYPLKSGDSVDVVFETADAVIGVEVKSKRSGTDDIERGLYQCVKYSAVLEAETKVNKSDAQTRCVLVIEGTLPLRLSRIRNTLRLDVFQNISPKEEPEKLDKLGTATY